MHKINIGIVGLGWWGPKLLRNFKNHPYINKIYAHDISNEAINDALKSGLEFEPVKNYEDFFINDISSIVIATPPKTHFMLAKIALENEKHVLVTKPPSETMNEFDILAKIAKEKNTIFMVDATYVFNPVLKTTSHILNKNGINSLKSIRFLRFGDDLRKHHINRIKNTMFKNKIDIVSDLIFHDISTLIYLFNSNLQIEFIKSFNNLNSNISDSAIIFLKVKNIPVTIEYSWVFPERKREFQFYYEDKFLIFDDLSQDNKVWEFFYEKKETRIINYDRSEPLFCEIDHFISCIKTGATPITGLIFMKKAMKIMGRIENFLK